MDIVGERVIKAPRDAVWTALNDPEVLKACILGCEEIEQHSDTELNATVVARFGPVKATFKADITLEDLNPPESYKLVGQGQGGIAGFAKGGAAINLDEVEDGTLLRYNADMAIGGKLAQVGSRLVGSTTKKLIASFFDSLDQHFEAQS
ncbi:MAG: carbon monoxide dehydrogenase subunit G [Pseudomonadota bacterium]